MKYRYLGRSGLFVSQICLGTMTFGNEQWGCDQETANRIVRTFLDAGGNFIDTADLYSGGVSETMLGKAIETIPRDELVLATKCWFPTGTGPNARGLSRKHIIEACEASMKRMGVDYLDLYQIHGPDPYTPVEETMRTLDDLVRSGKVRYVGCSNLYGWQITKAQYTAKLMGLERFVSAQHLYNLIRRDIEGEILPACDDLGIGMICWSPLAAGMLTGKYRGADRPAPDTRHGHQADLYLDRYWFDGALAMVDRVIETAEATGRTPAQIALAWLLGDERVTSVIVGARKPEQIADSIIAGTFDLETGTRQALTDALPFDHGYPKEWMDGTFPGTFGMVDRPPRHTQRLP